MRIGCVTPVARRLEKWCGDIPPYPTVSCEGLPGRNRASNRQLFVVSDQVDPLVQDAAENHRAGRLQDAERLYKRALRSNPRNADALNNFGLLSHEMGRIERSLEMLNRAVDLAPDRIDYRRNLAKTLQALGKYERAVYELRQCLNFEPYNIEVLEELCLILRKEADRVQVLVDRLKERSRKL